MMEVSYRPSSPEKLVRYLPGLRFEAVVFNPGYLRH